MATINKKFIFNLNDVINLASIEPFMVFSSNAAVSSTSVSVPTGFLRHEVGSNTSTVTGFDPAVYPTHAGDLKSAEVAAFLPNLASQINALAYTNTTHPIGFIGGEIVPPGVYLINGAMSIAGFAFLDSLGDSNAIWVFRVVGAFSVGASSGFKMKPGTNGISSRVFIYADGAMAVGASGSIVGNMLSVNAAISVGANCVCNNMRLFSQDGAIAIGAGCTFSFS